MYLFVNVGSLELPNRHIVTCFTKIKLYIEIGGNVRKRLVYDDLSWNWTKYLMYPKHMLYPIELKNRSNSYLTTPVYLKNGEKYNSIFISTGIEPVTLCLKVRWSIHWSTKYLLFHYRLYSIQFKAGINSKSVFSNNHQ